ncbi:AlbA family DNA-binding domain-containing protein [Streptomyces muensis]|uniref:ATP-binding protein n=1 Tax=Streptomyces muensis TaxID=1077944 RepID=A0A9X1TP15_STRM4|nr:ATP-binding protein [Streptomyces muensis]MCF1597339.1 ATP-binding protein [Streptomyces muensis]
MAALRSTRLERLLGVPVSDATHAHVHALINGAVPEDYDLDFKRELYGRNDAAKRALCGDVAAMANTSGGLIILGLDEDEHGSATAAPEVELSDDEKRRMLQTVAAGVSPAPQLDMIACPGTDPARGFYLIAVPRSNQGPHAVLVNDSLRFPRRNGSTTVYLSQPEVRAAYFSQFTAERDRAGQLETVEAELLADLDTSVQVFAVVTLAPDLEGGMTIDTAAMKTYQEQTVGRSPLIVNGSGINWMRAQVGPGRLTADGSSRPDQRATWLACHLHATGAGAFAAIVDRTDRGDSTQVDIGDEHLADGLLSGLQYLARHARDRAAASGNVFLRATVHPLTAECPARLVHYRHHGFPEPLGARVLTRAVPAVTVSDVDDMAAGGLELVAAAHRLGSGLAQAFGRAEILQFSPEGELRRRYWSHESRPALERWAQQGDVKITDDEV